MIDPLIDPAARARNVSRAHRLKGDHFLIQAAIDEAQDRSAFVNKTFTKIGIVTAFPELWAEAFPDGILIPEAETLDLSAGPFDLIIHGMCLHWANDPVGQLIQSRRALRPDGLFLAITLGESTLHELRQALTEAEARVCDGLSPRLAPMAEVRTLGALLQRAGFALPVADQHSLTAHYADMIHLMRDLRGLGETNALTQRAKSFARREMFMEAAAAYAARHATPDGRVVATFDLITLTGWAPDPSQPQPLRPGSATTRLADALNTVAPPLDD